jgi:hypothetical protein
MKIIDLFEAPIEDISHVGDWSRNSSFKEPDRKLLTNPKAIKKITDKWQKTSVNFNIYLVNNAEANRYTEVGKVPLQWLEEKMPKTFPLLDIKHNAVNLIFTNNKGTEKVPMTAWIMAHRFGHVVYRARFPIFYSAEKILLDTMILILQDGYGKHLSLKRYTGTDTNRILVNFYSIIGTMKSARDKNIRSNYEFLFELLAQYMLSGNIKFNRLPLNAKMGKDTFNFVGPDTDLEYYNGILDDCANELANKFTYLLQSCVGEILVM